MSPATQPNSPHWQLYQTHRAALFAYAHAITHSPERAEDALHDAMVSVARTRTRPDNSKAYVFRAVRNEAYRHAKRYGRDVSLESFDYATLFAAPSDAEPDAQSSRREEAELLAKSLDRISQDEREVIILHLYAGMKFREIAETTQQPLPTTTSRYRRGLAKLGGILEEVRNEIR